MAVLLHTWCNMSNTHCNHSQSPTSKMLTHSLSRTYAHSSSVSIDARFMWSAAHIPRHCFRSPLEAGIMYLTPSADRNVVTETSFNQLTETELSRLRFASSTLCDATYDLWEYFYTCNIAEKTYPTIFNCATAHPGSRNFAYIFKHFQCTECRWPLMSSCTLSLTTNFIWNIMNKVKREKIKAKTSKCCLHDNKQWRRTAFLLSFLKK